MAFNGKEGNPITLDQAKRWTKRYRDDNKGAVKAHFYGCEQLQKLLKEPGCMGIRIYYAIDDRGKKRLVLVGANAKQNNLLPKNDGKDGGDDVFILDDGVDCPEDCGSSDDPLSN